jgi:hypothetical protein
MQQAQLMYAKRTLTVGALTGMGHMAPFCGDLTAPCGWDSGVGHILKLKEP